MRTSEPLIIAAALFAAAPAVAQDNPTAPAGNGAPADTDRGFPWGVLGVLGLLGLLGVRKAKG
jgi:hypothetical protein